MKVSIRDLESSIRGLLRTKYDDDSARMIADVILFGELCGRSSHGLIRLLPNRYGPLDEKPSRGPELLMKGRCSASILGHGNPGMLLASLAMKKAIEIAKQEGVAIVGTQGSFTSSGSLTYYAEKIAKEDLVGILMAQTGPCAATFNGAEKIFGTNPIAFAIPGETPLIFDMSTTAISYGEVALRGFRGKPLPAGVALDEAGVATTDPEKALRGALLPFIDSPKGAGLAMIVELFAGLFAGASFCGRNDDQGWGHLFLVFSPTLLIDLNQFKDKVRIFSQAILSQKARSGKTIRLPGDSTLKTRDENLRRGTVEVDEALYSIFSAT